MARLSCLTASAAFLTAAALSAPAQAQPPAFEADSLADASAQVGTGLDLARRQLADADLLGAAGTLERVLLNHPEADGPRALYASILCRLDDPQGADVELALLRGRIVPDEARAELAAACGRTEAREEVR